MRRAILLFAYALLALLVPTLLWSSLPGAPAPAEEKELAALQGAWGIVGKEFMGKKASEEEMKKLTGRIVFKADKLTVWLDDAGQEMIVSESTFKVDAAKNPKTMDLKYTRGFGKGETQLAIYEIDGDTLRVCYSFGEGEKRPTEFAGKLDGKSLFLTYKRLKQ